MSVMISRFLILAFLSSIHCRYPLETQKRLTGSRLSLKTPGIVIMIIAAIARRTAGCSLSTKQKEDSYGPNLFLQSLLTPSSTHRTSNLSLSRKNKWRKINVCSISTEVSLHSVERFSFFFCFHFPPLVSVVWLFRESANVHHCMRKRFSFCFCWHGVCVCVCVCGGGGVDNGMVSFMCVCMLIMALYHYVCTLCVCVCVYVDNGMVSLCVCVCLHVCVCACW